MANECIPKYEPGQDLTGQVTTAGGVLGKRFLALTGDKQGSEAVSDDTTGGNVLVGYPAAGGITFGVSGYDAAQNRKVKIVRGKGKVVPVRCAAALVFNQEVQSDATGQAVPYTGAITPAAGAAVPRTPWPAGRCIRSAAINTDALIELY